MDNNNQDGYRLTEAEYKEKLHLLADGTDVTNTYANNIVVTDNGNNIFSVKVTGLPKKANGTDIRYTWTEEEVVGYKLERKVTNGTVTTFTNAPVTIPQPPEEYKKPKVPTGWYEIKDYQTALGIESTINHVGDCFD